MLGVQAYVHKGRRILRTWALNPRLYLLAQGLAYGLGGFCLSAASLGNWLQPVAMGLVCALSGWSAVISAIGSLFGYWLFWGQAGFQAMVWVATALCLALAIGDRRITRQTPALLPAAGALIISAWGVVFQALFADNIPLHIYFLRVGMGAGCTLLFQVFFRERNPVANWLTGSVAVLALAQLVPFSYFGLGYIAAGGMAVLSAFPAVALAGLALDLARITPVSMTAVLTMSYLARLLPRYPHRIARFAPASTYLLVMALCGHWDLYPLPALLLGGIIGSFLPAPGKVAHRRGETGVAQVRLELAAGVLSQTEQLLLESPPVPVDEDALVARAAERACGSCPSRRGCKDARRIAQLPGPVLHKPLLAPEELPIQCRKSGRFLAELHRSQEQLRSIRADRERQREYRSAVMQQYRFLALYLQDLSDQLGRRTENAAVSYSPEVRIYGNRPQADNGDRCQRFMGTGGKYYVLLCDGMGTGLGAIQEGKTAASMLRRLLCAGYPAKHALRSINSLCALRDRAGAATIDLAELCLNTGKGAVYKWGAAPSYLMGLKKVERLGNPTPPPGLSVTDQQEAMVPLSLRRGEILLLVSDGVAQEQAMRCCTEHLGQPPETVASSLLTGCALAPEEDATVIAIRLFPAGPGT